MNYVYVLMSEKDKNNYVGFTQNVEKRLGEHNKGLVTSTRNRRPLKLIYFEASFDQTDATNREKYLKSSWGKRYMKNRLKYFLKN